MFTVFLFPFLLTFTVYVSASYLGSFKSPWESQPYKCADGSDATLEHMLVPSCVWVNYGMHGDTATERIFNVDYGRETPLATEIYEVCGLTCLAYKDCYYYYANVKKGTCTHITRAELNNTLINQEDGSAIGSATCMRRNFQEGMFGWTIKDAEISRYETGSNSFYGCIWDAKSNYYIYNAVERRCFVPKIYSGATWVRKEGMISGYAQLVLYGITGSLKLTKYCLTYHEIETLDILQCLRACYTNEDCEAVSFSNFVFDFNGPGKCRLCRSSEDIYDAPDQNWVHSTLRESFLRNGGLNYGYIFKINQTEKIGSLGTCAGYAGNSVGANFMKFDSADPAQTCGYSAHFDSLLDAKDKNTTFLVGDGGMRPFRDGRQYEPDDVCRLSGRRADADGKKPSLVLVTTSYEACMFLSGRIWKDKPTFWRFHTIYRWCEIIEGKPTNITEDFHYFSGECKIHDDELHNFEYRSDENVLNCLEIRDPSVVPVDIPKPEWSHNQCEGDKGLESDMLPPCVWQGYRVKDDAPAPYATKVIKLKEGMAEEARDTCGLYCFALRDCTDWSMDVITGMCKLYNVELEASDLVMDASFMAGSAGCLQRSMMSVGLIGYEYQGKGEKKGVRTFYECAQIALKDCNDGYYNYYPDEKACRCVKAQDASSLTLKKGVISGVGLASAVEKIMHTRSGLCEDWLGSYEAQDALSCMRACTIDGCAAWAFNANPDEIVDGSRACELCASLASYTGVSGWSGASIKDSLAVLGGYGRVSPDGKHDAFDVDDEATCIHEAALRPSSAFAVYKKTEGKCFASTITEWNSIYDSDQYSGDLGGFVFVDASYDNNQSTTCNMPGERYQYLGGISTKRSSFESCAYHAQELAKAETLKKTVYWDYNVRTKSCRAEVVKQVQKTVKDLDHVAGRCADFMFLYQKKTLDCVDARAMFW